MEQPALGRQSENSSYSRDIHGVCHGGAQVSAFHVHLLQSRFFHGSDIDENSEREKNESVISTSILPTPGLEPLLCGTERDARSFYDCAQSVVWDSGDDISESSMVTFTLDSASDIHVIQLNEAVKYFSEKSESNL